MSYAVLTCARNEEGYIGACISSITNQTRIPRAVVVVDDGSRDFTSLAANAFGLKEFDHFRVLYNQDRGFSALDTYYMADPYNLGLEYLSKLEWDYLLILGADTWIPPEYVETLLDNLTPDLGVISGSYPGIKPSYASATGRLIRREIITELGGRLPRSYAWESSVTHCARYMGYEIGSFPVRILNMRPPGSKPRRYIGRGKAARDLGYHWPYAVARGLRRILQGKIRMGLHILTGYFIHRPKTFPAWAEYINESQKRQIGHSIKRRLYGN